MGNIRFTLGCLAVAGMILAPAGIAGAERLPGSDHGGIAESATLLGANQVPAVATPGSGTAQITINPGHNELCFHITVSDLTGPALAAHIHQGPAGTNGPIVVPFVAPTDGTSQGCVSVEESLLNQIRSDPSGFYVNVHTFQNMGGEVRGQLAKGH